MKTLQEIQSEYAKENKCNNWAELVEYYIYWDNGRLLFHIDEVAKRFAIEVAKEALDNAYEATKETLQEFAFKREGQLSKCLSESIKSETNIPKI